MLAKTINFYPDQEQLYFLIKKSAQEKKTTLIQAETGFGKSVVIAKLSTDLSKNNRVLILTHRIEIFEQNSEWLSRVGVLTSEKNSVSNNSKIVIAMVQTLYARVKRYGIGYIGEFDVIIIDEPHIDIFEKLVNLYSYKMKFGLTATPILDKTRTIVIDGKEYIQKVTLSEYYDNIVCGPSVKELIKAGRLVQEHNISLVVPNINGLHPSKANEDGYTPQSLNKVFGTEVSIKVVKTALKTYCVGKKTIIFNPTTKVNINVYNALKKDGYNVRVYDSVNSKASERKEVVDWFKNQKEAILINANVFTTGFNDPEVEAIIMNGATKSLKKYIQIVGRGGRPSSKLLKERFLFIDLGMNIERFGRWSDKRDWKKYFFPQPPTPKKNIDLLQIWECGCCGAYNVKGTVVNIDGDIVCGTCNEKKIHKLSSKSKISGKLVSHNKPPLPTSKKIINYVIGIGGDTNKAFKLLENMILDLFILHNIDKDYYLKRRADFIKRVGKIYIPVYFGIIKSGLKGKNRKLNTQLNKMIKKIDDYYGC